MECSARAVALKPLLLLVKALLRQQGLGDASQGGLGSYAVTIMLTAYLDQAPPMQARHLTRTQIRTRARTHLVDAHARTQLRAHERRHTHTHAVPLSVAFVVARPWPPP